MIENRVLEGMWKERAVVLFEVLPRNLDYFSFLPQRNQFKRFYKDERINFAK
jgi:hypothetical protein